jgi:AraC family transcriptional regulator of adaptative response/methylated-DNA-[protein]-cysteine methyltransferase
MSSKSTTFEATSYRTIARAIQYIREHATEDPPLADIAQVVGMEKLKFRRLFLKWAGTTPERFAKFLTKEHAKALLSGSESVLHASLHSGLSSPSRLHDLFVTYEAMSPGEWKRGGVAIRYGIFESPFGACLLAATHRGICEISFLEPGTQDVTLEKKWPNATIVRDDASVKAIFHQIFQTETSNTPIHLVLRGTNFQIKVWEALLSIPRGQVASYSDIARAIGHAKAVRAVGSACGANDIALLIPCHRVLTANGALGNYRWGVERKETILAWESVPHHE